MYDNRVDIMCVCETWLNSATPDSFVSIDGYTIVRTDVVGEVRKHGVCIYVAESISFESVNLAIANLHAIRLHSSGAFVLVVYRPPSNTAADNTRLVEFIGGFVDGREVLLVGDLNLPGVDWVDGFAVSSAGDSLSIQFSECFNLCGFTQWVSEPTFCYSDNILDIVLTNVDDRVGDVTVLPPFPHCGHSPVLLSYMFMKADAGAISRSVTRCWHRGNYNGIIYHLSLTDWDFEFDDLDVDGIADRFVSLLASLINYFIPTKFKSNSKKQCYNPPTALKKERKRAWDQYKQMRSDHGRRSEEAIYALSVYEEINDYFRNYQVSCQSSYEFSLSCKFKEKPKLFHHYIRSKKVGAPKVGPLRLHDGTISDDGGTMAELFSRAFASVFSNVVPASPVPHVSYTGTIDSINIDLDEVEQELCELDDGGSMGPDDLHPCLLKSCRSQLAYPLWYIFCISLSVGIVPQAWKLSNVICIFKKGSRYNPLNYRPISLNSVCSKVMERIVAKKLTMFLDDNSILSADQYGFRAGRSVEDQLLVTYNEVTEWLNCGHCVDVVLFDFAKAFDSVCHSIPFSLISCMLLVSAVRCFLGWSLFLLVDL